MAARVLILAAATSVLAVEILVSAEPKTQEFSCGTIHHETCSGRDSRERPIHARSQIKKGPAESLIESLNSKLQEAEEELGNPKEYPPHYKVTDGEEFDFIVVGAGSAGAVVANRLSEKEKWKVLLVEAGGDPPIASEIPALIFSLQGTEVDWQYKTDAEEEICLGMVDKKCRWPRGKVLGGSSTINYMMYTRGNAKDFDGWAAVGNQGWSYDEVLPYFKKSEDLKSSEIWALEDSKKYHSAGGLLSVDKWPDSDKNDFSKALSDALESFGYSYNPDCNSKNMTGVTQMQGTLKEYRRCSTAKAFLSSAKQRKNLFVSKNALVTKVLFDKESTKVIGIDLINSNGRLIKARARKEVILSAGAINSPQLLMLSGIGPRQHLQDLGIPVVKDLPVGQNLQDHPLMKTFVITTNITDQFTPPTIKDTFNFLLKQPSALSSLGYIPDVAYVNIRSRNDHPDVELFQLHFPKNSPELLTLTLSVLFNDDKKTIDEYIKINKDAYTVIIAASMLRPFSRGSITLQDVDPHTHPKITAGTFSDNRDIQTYLRVYDFVSRLVETESLKRIDAKFLEVRVPSCEKHAFASSAYRECAMRHLTGTTYHYSGTCKMGPPGDPTAVVDDSLRVYGIKGLRVVDASVMPKIVSAHTNAAVIMIGEKASDLVKDTWKGS